LQPRVRTLTQEHVSLTNILSVKFWIRIDDSMDVFAEHGIAGMVGLIFNALFAADYIIGLDGVNTGAINGGWLNHNYRQLYVQLAYIVAVTGYSFTMSAILASIINWIPGLHLRASEEAELLGMDDDQLGEFAYDYVEVRRDYLAWTPAKDEPHNTESDIPSGDRYGIPQHSDMINGHSPERPTGNNEHTGVMGDRHGVAAEDEIKEKRGVSRTNGNINPNGMV
jgi:Amt family ammonium transporter